MDLPTLPSYLFEPNLKGVLSLFLAIVLPVLVALVTKKVTRGDLKGVILLGFAAVKSVVEAVLVGGSDFNLTTTIYTTLINFGIAVLFYFGLLKHSDVLAKAQDSLVK